MSSHDLASLNQASPSTVVRFARSLGFAGFPEFQAELRQLILDRMGSATRLYSTLATRSDDDLFTNCLQADIAALEEARRSISLPVFATIAELIAGSDRIYVLGLGISTAVVDALTFRLRRLRLDVHPVTRGGSDLLEPLFALNAEHLIIAVAFQRIRPEILWALDFSRLRSAKIVAFAEHHLSQHALKADHVLITRRGPAETLNSLAVPMAVVNALSLAVSQHRQKDSALAYGWLEDYQRASTVGHGVSPSQTSGVEKLGENGGDDQEQLIE